MIENKKIFVLGLARSGFAVSKLLCDKNEIVVVDKSDSDIERISQLEKLGVKFIKSETGEEVLDESFDLMIKNPGIEPKQACVKKAISLNIPIVNEMEVAYHYLPENVKIIGITGSNGKTTTTTILYNLLKMHNIDVTLGGNIGTPLSEVVQDIKSYFKERVYDTIIPRLVRLSEAPSHGKPIIAYDPKSRGAEAYINLAKEVISRNGK